MERLIQQEPQGVVVDIVVTLILPPRANATATPYSDKNAAPDSHQRHYKKLQSPLSETHRERQTGSNLFAMKAKANLPKRGLQGQYAQNLSTTMAKSIPLKTYLNTINSTVSLHTQNLPAPAVLPSSNPLTQRSPKTQNPNHQQQQQALPRLLLLQDCTHHHKYPPPAFLLGPFCHNRVHSTQCCSNGSKSSQNKGNHLARKPNQLNP